MKLPEEAFEYYVSLGPKRSYQAVADRYGVQKKTVTTRAVRDRWQARLRDIQERAQQEVEDRMVDSLAEMNERHLRVLQAILARGLEALQSIPIASGWDAVKSLDLAMRREAEIRRSKKK